MSADDYLATRDYILGIIVMGMMFFIVGKFFVDRWRPVLGSKDFHPSRPWKIPYTTTPGGIWLRVGFITVVSICVFAVLASILVLGTTAQTPFMVLLGSLLVLRIPHLYWSMRGRYEVMRTKNVVGTIQFVLRYRGGSGSGVALFAFHPPEHGDVIIMVFPKDPTRDVVKRVIGLPGDVIEIDSGQVIRNGKRLDEPYVAHQDARTFDPIRIPQSSYYVLGDNRLISSDSRHWGFVPEDHIIGRAWLSYWPSDRIAFLHALW